MSDLVIEPLPPASSWIAEIARLQFEHWGPLTGQPSREAYAEFLEAAATSADLPRTIVARHGETLLGSVNLVRVEMTIRPELVPWMGQLFVMPQARGSGTGERLCEAATAYAATLGFVWLHLFTSGTLPAYYRARGWRDVEEVEYLGKLRTVMRRSAPIRPSRRSTGG